MTVIYQITDPHIPLDDDDPVQKNYLRLMQYVTENPADLLVITGDLPAVGQDGSARVYQWIKSKIPSGQKTYVIPGNHDDSATMYAEFGEEFCGNADFCFSLPLDEIDLVFSNTGSGKFPREQLNYLQQSRENSILFTHYPTRKISDGYMDITYPLGNIPETHSAISSSPIGYVFCGHFHTHYSILDGYELNVTPSPAFDMDLNKKKPTVSPPRIPVCRIEISGSDVSSKVIYLDE